MYGWKNITSQTGTVVTLAEIKKQLEIADDVKVHDMQLDAMLTAAAAQFEKHTNCLLLQRDVLLQFDSLPIKNCLPLYLPIYPIQSINSFTIDGTAVDLADYVIDLTGEPHRIGLQYGNSWPLTVNQIASVQIEATIGHAAEDVPFDIKQSLVLLVAHWFEHREAVVTGTIVANMPYGVEMLWDSYKLGDDFMRGNH